MFSKNIVTRGGDKFRDEFSLAFDGSDDYVETSFVPDYISTNATTAFWVKMNDFSSDQLTGIMHEKRWYHGFSSSNLFIGVANTHNGSSLITPSPALVVGQWIHYCVTAIGGTATVYINGVAQGTMSYTQSSGTDPNTGYMIGARDDSGGASQYMNGNISEVVHYNVGLTANQVKTIYNGREPYNHKEGVASGNLQAWYRMGDGSLDDFNLINDETNTTLGNTMITGDFDTQFTEHNTDSNNTVTYPTTTSVTIVSDGSQAVGIQDANLLTSGKAYKCIIDVTINSGSGIRMQDSSTVFQTMTSTGVYTFYFIPSSTQFYIYRRTASASNTTINSMVLQEFGGKAGTMMNMSADDIEGDTP
jgi:hypothetical protein